MSHLSQEIADLSPKQRAILELRLKEKRAGASRVQIHRQCRGLDHVPLSFAQQRLWFLDQLQPGSPTYNIHGAIRFRRQFTLSALEASLGEIARRHEVLRTTFLTVNGQPVQVIAPVSVFKLSVVELGNLTEGKRGEEALRLATKEAQRAFDLTQGPLLRVTLLRLAAQDHVLLVTMHHVISDEWSVELFMGELVTLYEGFATGKPSPLEELPIQYSDFATWQREWLQGEVLERQLAYWRQKLDGVPAVFELPSDRPRPPVLSSRGAAHAFAVSRFITEELKALSKREGVTLFMTVLAAFKTLLYRYAGQQDIVVGTPIANRNWVEVERLIGFFANTLALRTDFSADLSFRELLQSIREVVLGAYAHQDLPFEKIIEELRPERNLSHAPLVQVEFALHTSNNTPASTLGRRHAAVTEIDMHNGMSKFDLTLSMADQEERLTGYFEFNTDLFDGGTIVRMFSHFQTLLEGIVADPEQRLSRLPLLTDRERHQLVVEWNNAAAEYPQQCVHELVELQVEKAPDRIAVVYEDEQLTYEELSRRANQLGNHLRTMGIAPDVLVGIFLERSVEMIVGLLAILKAGGAYLPLDSDHPKQRLVRIMEDAHVPVVLTVQRLLSRLPETGADVICLDSGWEEIAAESAENLRHQVMADNLAYVLYTSGSTGTPKGTLITHRGLVNYLHWCTEAYDVARGEGAPVHSPITSDLTVTSLFSPLLAGGKLLLLGEQFGVEALCTALAEGANFSFVKLTPAHLEMLNQQLGVEAAATCCRALIIGGEALSAERLAFWRTHARQTRLINEYGPTETVVGCCIYEVGEEDGGSGLVPIGRPIANTQLYIIDRRMEPVPIGVIGEVYIGGEGVARGYLNRPELTAERFIPNPFSGAGARVYASGDEGRYLADGNIVFLGRTDGQMKIRGYRVEPAEIEAVLLEVAGIKQAVVVAREDEADNKRVVAYLVCEDHNPPPTEPELRTYLKQKLPEYMIPATFVTMESLPLTSNGKVDRKALPPPEGVRQDTQETFAAPRDEIEIQLAAIWEDTLNIRPIGIKEDFFDLGGNSFLAVHLMARISEHFGQRLAISIILEAHTIEELADVLRGKVDPTSRSPLVPIQPRGSKRPFFGVHPGSGFVFVYTALARHLGLDQPFYGLEDPFVYGRKNAYASLEERAADYVKALRVVQPEGPYFLGGYSFGGHVAFEMAQILMRQGHEIALLAVLDTFAPIHTDKFANPADEALLMSIIKKDLRDVAANRTANQAGDFPLVGPNEQFNFGLDKLTNHDIRDIEERVLQASVKLFKSRIEAVRNYVPQIYSGRITLIHTTQPPSELSDQLRELHLMRLEDPTHGWGTLSTEPVEIIEISGEHATILREPHVQLLAEKLKACLDRAQVPGTQYTASH